MKIKFFFIIAKAALSLATASLFGVFTSCSDTSGDCNNDYAVLSSMNSGTASVKTVSEVSADSRSLSMPYMTESVRIFSDLQPGYGNAVYFTGTFKGASKWSVALRGTYCNGKWYLDVSNGDFEWKCLTGAWDCGESVETPYDGLTWEAGSNKIFSALTVDFNDAAKTAAYYTFYDVSPKMKVFVDTVNKKISQVATIDGTEFALESDFSLWNGLMNYEQARKCSELFWKFYPYIYKRLANNGSPTIVRLRFGIDGVAYALGDRVTVNQEHLGNSRYDFDCLTHEFTHIVQGGWDGNFCPSFTRADGSIDTYMIERFADVGRYEYAYNNGYYNDYGWDLQDIKGESAYWSSNRFWVWIDYKFSTEKIDILKRLNTAVYNKTFSSDDYGTSGKAWNSIFTGTDAAGKTLTQLWDMYAADDFSSCSARARGYGSKSPLIKTYNVREIIKARYN